MKQRDLLRRLARSGWHFVGMTGRKHLKLRHATGAVASIPGSPGDWRNARNVAAILRRRLATCNYAAGSRRPRQRTDMQ